MTQNDSAKPYSARKKAKQAHDFRIHVIVFIPVILAELLINYLTGGYPWSLWVLAGWSFGLAAHWFFALGPGAGRDRPV